MIEKKGNKSKKVSLMKGGRASENVKLKKKRGKKKSSQAWLERQLNDPYVRQAQKEGYRSRAVYKLMEIDEVFDIFAPWQKIVDLGAAPGGWCQYASQKIAGNGVIVGVDLLPVEPLNGCTILEGDFTDDEIIKQLEELLEGKADVVMSDMAPNTTGHAKTDHIRIMAMLEIALDFAMKNLKDNGCFIAKVFRGGTEKELLDTVKKYFDRVKHFKPEASRKESNEIYLIAQGFRSEKLKQYYEEVYGQTDIPGLESGIE